MQMTPWWISHLPALSERERKEEGGKMISPGNEVEFFHDLHSSYTPKKWHHKNKPVQSSNKSQSRKSFFSTIVVWVDGRTVRLNKTCSPWYKLHPFCQETYLQDRASVTLKCLDACQIRQGPYLDSWVCRGSSHALVYRRESHTPNAFLMAAQSPQRWTIRYIPDLQRNIDIRIESSPNALNWYQCFALLLFDEENSHILIIWSQFVSFVALGCHATPASQKTAAKETRPQWVVQRMGNAIHLINHYIVT